MKKSNKRQAEDDKVKIIDDFCRHIEKGYSEYSFVDYDFRDIERFATDIDKNNNNNLQVEKVKKSLRKSFLFWKKLHLKFTKMKPRSIFSHYGYFT